MAISKVLIGIVAGGVPAVAVTTAASLGAFTSTSSSSGQTNPARPDDSGSRSNSPKSDLPNYIPLKECQEVSTDRATGIKLIFCTDSKFYLYGADKSVIGITNLEIKSNTEILVKQANNQQLSNKIFPISDRGWEQISKAKNLNESGFCGLNQQDQTSDFYLVCQGNREHPIKLSKLQQ